MSLEKFRRNSGKPGYTNIDVVNSNSRLRSHDEFDTILNRRISVISVPDSECKTLSISSRVCELGTKSCIVNHLDKDQKCQQK